MKYDQRGFVLIHTLKNCTNLFSLFYYLLKKGILNYLNLAVKRNRRQLLGDFFLDDVAQIVAAAVDADVFGDAFVGVSNESRVFRQKRGRTTGLETLLRGCDLFRPRSPPIN